MTLVMLFSIVVGPGSWTKVKAADANTVTLQILATSDTHGRFTTYNYATNLVDTSGSLAQLSTAVKAARAENPDNTVLVDDGDIIQDNSESLFLNADNPMIKAMNKIGYDTITLGNHEFNNGIPTLKTIMGSSNATILCGNVYNPDGSRLYQSYKIVTTKGGIKVGIIGMTTPNITKWDSVNLTGYKVTDPVEETKAAIKELTGKVDAIVAVEHMGEDNEYDVADSGVKDLANACPELTAIVAGHAHSTIPGDVVNGVKIVEPGCFGQQLGTISIKFTQNNGKNTIADKANDVTSTMTAMSPKGGTPVSADQDILSLVKPYNDIALADANKVVGKLTGGDLVSSDEVNGIPSCQIKPSAMIDLINKTQMYYGQQICDDKKPVDVSAAAAFDSRANIKEGDIKKSDTSLIYKYDNNLWLYEVTGKQLKQYMEWSATYYNTYKDGDLTISFNPDIRGYNYDMFTGVKYDVDISKDPGSRIVNLTKMDGTPIKDTDVLRLTVNDYRGKTNLGSYGTVFKTGDTLPKLIAKSEDKMPSELQRVRDLIGAYIVNVKGGTITPECDNNWKVIGNNWDAAKRAKAVELINSGKLQLPKSVDGRTPNVKAVTWDDVKAANKVDVVSFNDFHGSILEDVNGKNLGIEKLASAINSYKNSNPDTILVSGGDNYQGSAVSNLEYGAPVNEFFKLEGLIASAVGNHEFDWGTDRIANWAKDGNFDFLASNIYSKTTGKPVVWAKPYKIVEKSGIKIGFIGLSTPETLTTTKAENVSDLEFKDYIQSANDWGTKLKNGFKDENGNTVKADVVIALTHLGAMQDSKTQDITGEAANLCNGIKNNSVDAVISAHTHQMVCGKVNGIPVVQAYYNGRSLADLSITLDIDTNKPVSIVGTLNNLFSNKKNIVENADAKNIVTKYVGSDGKSGLVGPILSEVVGTTDTELSYDSRTFPGTSVLGKWVCDVMRNTAGTQIALTNGGGLRCPIPAGPITMGKLYEVMPFDNTLVKMQLKGSDLKRVLENGIMNTNIGWIQASGIKVYYDKDAQAGNRITAMYLLDGTKISMDDYYSVVTNDFMSTIVPPYGDGYNFAGAKNLVNTNVPIRDALATTLKALNGKHLVVTLDQPLVAGPAPTVPVNPTTPTITVIPNDTQKVVTAVKTSLDTTVDISSNSVVSKDVFAAIAGTEKTVTFQKDGVTWKFSGKDIDTSLIKDVDLSLKQVSNSLKAKEAAKVKAMLGKDVKIASFSFNYDGKLPGKATITINIGKDWAGKTVSICRYYDDKNTYEVVASSVVDKDGNITFITDHCSDYFVVDSNVAKLPQTGSPVDTGVLIDLGAFLMATGAAFVVIEEKKRKKAA